MCIRDSGKVSRDAWIRAKQHVLKPAVLDQDRGRGRTAAKGYRTCLLYTSSRVPLDRRTSWPLDHGTYGAGGEVRTRSMRSTPVLQTGVHSTLDITCMEEGGAIETLRHH